MEHVIRLSGQLEQLPVKNIQHTGIEGARTGLAVLPDGHTISVYKHPENGRDVWYEQTVYEAWQEPSPWTAEDLAKEGE